MRHGSIAFVERFILTIKPMLAWLALVSFHRAVCRNQLAKNSSHGWLRFRPICFIRNWCGLGVPLAKWTRREATSARKMPLGADRRASMELLGAA